MPKIYRVFGKRGRITIPYEIRQKVGLSYNDILSFCDSTDGKTVLLRREKICNDCKNEVTLAEFLDTLSEEQQRAVLVCLSVK